MRLDHPFLSAVQLATAAAIAVVAAVTPAPAPREVVVALSFLGESETESGGWRGVDLLERPSESVDRFQLTLTPSDDVQLTVDELENGIERRVFPLAHEDGALKKGRSYALPAPAQFYVLKGRPRLRLRFTTASSSQTQHSPARASGPVTAVTYPLSDGAPFSTTRKPFVVQGQGSLELLPAGR
jgi:hypothetical protein